MKIGFYVQTFESLGVEYLSAALKLAGHETCIFFDPRLGNDLIYENAFLARLLSIENILIEQMIEADLDLVAFSVTTDTYAVGLAVAEKLKGRTDVPTVFGGIHVTSVPERVIAKDAVDYAIIGEAEEALVDLANALAQGQSATHIPNVCSMRNRHAVINPPRPLVVDLDTLPFPDKDLFLRNAAGFRPSAYAITTTRGCPFACTYCCNSILRVLYKGKGKFHRRRSVANVIDELEWARNRYSFDRILFRDDEFIGDIKWLEEFASEYRARVNLPFFILSSPAAVTTDTARLLAEAGCWEVAVGIQTICEDTRRKYLRRTETNEDIVNAIATVKDAKMLVCTCSILQLPGQTNEEVRSLAEFYCDNAVDFPHVFLLRYYPRTDIVKIGREEGLITDEQIEIIEEPTRGRAMSYVQPEDNRDLAKLRALLALVGVLPRSVSHFLLRNNRYRYFPLAKSTHVLIEIACVIKRFTTGKKHFRQAFSLTDYFLHYMRFACIKIKWKLRRNTSS